MFCVIFDELLWVNLLKKTKPRSAYPSHSKRVCALYRKMYYVKKFWLKKKCWNKKCARRPLLHGRDDVATKKLPVEKRRNCHLASLLVPAVHWSIAWPVSPSISKSIFHPSLQFCLRLRGATPSVYFTEHWTSYALHFSSLLGFSV